MESKLFELRDKATMIAILAVRVSAADGYLARRAGYGGPCVLLTRLDGGGKAQCDCYAWGDRTFTTAHAFIEQNWETLRSGQVVDVEHIRGETAAPKVSEEAEVPQ